MLEFLVDNIFVVFGGKGFPTDSRHSNGHELCPSPSRHISVLIRSGIHTVFSLSTGKKKLASQFNFTYRYIEDVLSINNPDFLKIIWVRCIRLSLKSKTQRRATLLLPTWIYSCRSRVTVSCALPFTTNVTISTSISQTLRS